MATKVIVLGKEEKQTKKNPIVFVSYLGDDQTIESSGSAQKPANWDNIELVSKNYTQGGLDLMFAYDDDRNDAEIATLFFGHFNDGIV